jgi:hypothetical protein
MKLSSRAALTPLAYKIEGVMTVARFAISIRDPVSSSRYENDATHLRKTNSTSVVSRLTRGSITTRRCKQRRRSSGFFNAIGQLSSYGGCCQLTSSSTEKFMQPECEERIRHLSQESLEQRSKLDRILIGKIDVGSILVERFRDLLQSTDISILSEDTFHGHICMSALISFHVQKSLPICRMVEMISSMISGTRSCEFEVQPCCESDPVRSTSISRGTPNTPGYQYFCHQERR